MNLAEVKEKAKMVGIKSGKMKKVDLVRAIQEREGYNSCFQTNVKSCQQMDCCWRGDCLVC